VPAGYPDGAQPPPQQLDQDWIDRVTGRDQPREPRREQGREPGREQGRDMSREMGRDTYRDARRDPRYQAPPPADRPYQ
jgi:penicillin-binding protein 1A